MGRKKKEPPEIKTAALVKLERNNELCQAKHQSQQS
jgi:hypothetical protein